MPPLKGVEQASFGGVDSRSNPVVEPLNRFLKLQNWRPLPDGHLELREGYTALDMSGDSHASVGAVHSMSSYMVATPLTRYQTTPGLPTEPAQIFPNGTECLFFWRNKTPYLRRLDTGATSSPPIAGAAIASSQRWHYALGKSGYLYMHNGIDMKFFDGVKLRDIGLPTLSAAQAGAISVGEGLAGPTALQADSVNFDFVDATETPPTLANVISGLMYMAYFDPTNDLLASCSEPLSGMPFPNGNTSTDPTTKYLQATGLPLPAKTGSVVLLYYPGADMRPTLMADTVCTFYTHDPTYTVAFEYKNPADPAMSGSPTLGTPVYTAFHLNAREGLMFNPGQLRPFNGWTLDTAGRIWPMVVAGVDNNGAWDGTKENIADAAHATADWAMTVEGHISIPAAGTYSFLFTHDDGALIGFGGGASGVSGYIDPAYQTLMADKGYPVMCSRQVYPNPWTHDVFTVSFPAPGLYPFEIDFCQHTTSQTLCLYNGDDASLSSSTPVIPGAPPAPGLKPIDDPSFLTVDLGHDNLTLSAPTVAGVPPTKVSVHLVAHGFSTGDVIVLSLHTNPDPSHQPDYTTPYAPLWTTNGPFAITVVDLDHFTFNRPDATLYDGATPITIYKLVTVTAAAPTDTTADYTIDTHDSGWPYRCQNGRDLNQSGAILLPGPLDGVSTLLPASAIGGAQPGYQFYASIYNPLTGHVGNRVPIGQRLVNTTPTSVAITGLPAVGSMRAEAQKLVWGNGTEVPKLSKGRRRLKQGKPYATTPIAFDPEWQLLIGRTGDGGEVPYALIDAEGTWISYAPNIDAGTMTIAAGDIDGNSELPTENYIPPPFIFFWREGDRQCGAVANYVPTGTTGTTGGTAVSQQPFVYRSGSEVDDTSGIFVGDPAQAWSPARTETFPTAEAIAGGFGNMQESWVFTKSHVGQLSELSGEVVWNGPYDFGVAGPDAFDSGWQSLPFWVSHDKQLCTMLPGSDGPVSISTEYESALLSQIGDDTFASDGTPINRYLSQTEVRYFHDPIRLVQVLRIRCLDNSANPFVVIHDFNLRDDSSPYGQAYQDQYQGPLTGGYTHERIRDSIGHTRMFAGAWDGNLYQFYSGGDDDGTNFTADAIQLRYMGGERTATKTIEWYGDGTIKWYLHEALLDVNPDIPLLPPDWVEVSLPVIEVPADAGSAHYMCDVDRPEMTHCYLWFQLVSHPVDALDPTNPMAWSDPPHTPLENYGRLYMATPLLGDARGR